VNAQVDQNGIVYDPKTDRKCSKNGAFTRGSRSSPIRLSPIIGESPEDVLAKVQWTLANWRVSEVLIGESLVDFRQLSQNSINIEDTNIFNDI
jgi:hypothetical protein